MFNLVPFTRKNIGLVRGDDFFGFDKFFNDFFNDAFMSRVNSFPMRADVRETENEWLIDAEMPGVNKNDIQIDLKDGYLTIAVEQKQEENEEKENFVRKERAYGSYKRSFYVEDVKEDEIKACYQDGILSVTLPKAKPEKKSGVRIEVQ